VLVVLEIGGLAVMRITVPIRPRWIGPGRIWDVWRAPAAAAAAAKVLGPPMAVEIVAAALRIPVCEVEVFTNSNSVLRRLGRKLFGRLADAGETGAVWRLASLLHSSVELRAFEARAYLLSRGSRSRGCEVKSDMGLAFGSYCLERFATTMRDREKVVEKNVDKENTALLVISVR
jgi:hypothetical protein